MRKYGTYIEKRTRKILHIPMTAVYHPLYHDIQQLDNHGGGVMHARFPGP